jgi:hypothetical protein
MFYEVELCLLELYLIKHREKYTRVQFPYILELGTKATFPVFMPLEWYV